MFKFAIALGLILSASSVAAQTVPTNIQLQSPCAVNTSVQVCMVVRKVVPVTAGPYNVPFSTAVAKPLIGKVRNFAVIYSIKSNRPDGGVSVMYKNGGIDADVDVSRPTLFWVTTNDGGRTWSKLTTTNMADHLVW